MNSQNDDENSEKVITEAMVEEALEDEAGMTQSDGLTQGQWAWIERVVGGASFLQAHKTAKGKLTQRKKNAKVSKYLNNPVVRGRLMDEYLLAGKLHEAADLLASQAVKELQLALDGQGTTRDMNKGKLALAALGVRKALGSTTKRKNVPVPQPKPLPQPPEVVSEKAAAAVVGVKTEERTVPKKVSSQSVRDL